MHGPGPSPDGASPLAVTIDDGRNQAETALHQRLDVPGRRAAAECSPDLLQARVQSVVEVNERTFRPDGALELFRADELPVTLQEMRQHPGGLRPQPDAPPAPSRPPPSHCRTRTDRTECQTDRTPRSRTSSGNRSVHGRCQDAHSRTAGSPQDFQQKASSFCKESADAAFELGSPV